MSVEELTGIVQGLAGVVKDQLTQFKLNQGETEKQIQDLCKAVSDLTNTSSTASSAVSVTNERPQTLRLPQVNLPSFAGQRKDDLERFLDQLTTLLTYSGCYSS